MKIAAFPKCWIEAICDGRMDLFEWIEMSAELACEGLEMYSGFLRSQEASHLKAVRDRVEGMGMTIPMYCYSPDFTQPEEAARREEVEKQKQAIRVTAELGGVFCRTLSGQRRPGVGRDEGVDRAVACIEACLPEAEQCGVTLAIENHYKDGFWEYPEFAQKQEIFLEILRRIDSPRFGVQYDPSNALLAGDDPIALLDAVLPRAVTMHASDRFLLPGYTLDDFRQADGTLGYPEGLVHGVTGRGMIDYNAVFARLSGAGYRGWISIEDGMEGMEEMAASVAFLKAMREKYDGSGPSPF